MRAKATRWWLGGTEFHVLHTPGHTRGQHQPVDSRRRKKLVAGDTLFRDSIGRTDLPGGDRPRILASIRDKLFTLPEEDAGDSRPWRPDHHRPRKGA